MLNKSKINISVILLTIGIGLIPTGFIANGFVKEQVRANLPSILLHIQDEAISEIEAQYLGLGITEVLPVIKTEQTENIKDEIVEVEFIPSTLLYLKNLAEPLFLERRNGSMTAEIISDSLDIVYNDILDSINGPLSAQIINDTLWQIMNLNSTNSSVARDLLFNNYTFQIDFLTSINSTAIRGVSEYITNRINSLNFTATAQERILDGYLTYPGLIDDVENGTGVLEFMELYENATNNPTILNDTILNYNATWDQLTSVRDYVSDYLWQTIIPQTWNNTISPSKYANDRSKELFFNDENWSTTTKNLTPIEGFSEYGTGGTSNLSYSVLAQQRILTGTVDVPGILDNILLGEGVLDYLGYFSDTSGNATMQAYYNATFYQLNNLTTYLTNYMMDIVIPAQLALEGLTLQSAALIDFYEQWANATIYTDGIQINELSKDIGDLLKARSAAIRIRDTINSLSPTYNSTIARDFLFNHYMFQINLSTSIRGVSEYYSGASYSLNFSTTSVERLLDGYGDYPGIFTSIKSGFGLLNWLDFYESAYNDIGTNRTLMQNVYNATWATQLLPFGQYLESYLLGTIIAEIAQTGLEAGRPTSTNIKYNTVLDLWDPMNSNAIVNDTGILKWYSAANGNQTIQDQLNATFNLSQDQFNVLYTWLIARAKNALTPTVFIIQQPLGIRLTTGEYAGILFLEQWANGTIIPSGIEILAGQKGLEVGIPIQSNISYNTALVLFDTDNSSSFIDNNGILKWIDAYNGDTVAKNDLILLFGLDSAQMDMILTWLFDSFRVNVVPNIVLDLIEQTTLDLAEYEFHRQWANGTLFINGIDLDPAFGLSSITDWEIGIPTDSNIVQSTSVALWNINNPYSLVHQKGNGLWFMATISKDAYDSLKGYHGLDDTQMNAIIVWFETMNEDYSLPYLKEKLNLPVDVYTYANAIQIGFLIGGIIFIALGAVSIILFFLIKRR